MSCEQQFSQWQSDHTNFLDAAAATNAALADQEAAQAAEAEALAAAAQATADREAADAVVATRQQEQNAANAKADASYSAWLDCMQIDSADARRLRRA